MVETRAGNYPNIMQSFGIAGIVIVSTILLSPLNLVLDRLVGKEASMTIYYLLAIGIFFGWVYFKMKSLSLSIIMYA